MNQLAEQLRAADQICTEAYPFFEKAASVRVDTDAKAKKCKKTAKIISVAAAVVFVGLASNLRAAFLREHPVIILAAGIALGIILYKIVLLPKIESVRSASMNAADAEEAKGARILEDNVPTLSIIPNDYWYPMATNYLLKVVQTGRADTVNQALQMFDEQLHRWKVEEANASIVAQQKAQTEALKGIRRSSAINAAANVVNAAANVSRWL